MLKAARLSKSLTAFLVAGLMLPGSLFAQEEAVIFKNREVTSTRDTFEQNFYYEGTSYLRLDRLYRALFRKESRAKSINVFDEVPDNTFFTNRHARKALTESELVKGSSDSGPDLSGPLTVLSGHFGESKTSLKVKDKRGDEYDLKFDHADHLDLMSGASLVANRIYHALGYNVPQASIVDLDLSQLVAGEGVQVVDGTGFSKTLTPEKLERYFMFLAQTEDGKYRALANKALPGELKGGFKFQGRRRNDPQDPYDHETRREVRALRVFASWLNHTDFRPSSTMDVLTDEGGQKVLKHYLIEFESALGSDVLGAKPPSFGHEHFVDFGETAKAILGVGLWEKPWQKRWKEAEEKTAAPAVGYFDSRRFEPGKFKTELPSYGFKDLTLADGFWAAKQIQAFKDSDIRAIVKAAGYTSAQDAEAVAQTLIERRDSILNYWFSEANPLDAFDIQNGKLVFEDLAVQQKSVSSQGRRYHVEVIDKDGKRGKKQTAFVSDQPAFAVDPSWGDQVDLLIRVSSDASGGSLSPYVLVETAGGKVVGILRQD